MNSVEFFSEGTRVKGHLYLPAGAAAGDRFPAVLLCHGFAGTKEMLLPAFAQRFAENGFVALTFDYRGFGESDGEAGRIVPALQVQDIRNALTFLAAQPQVAADRLGLWGTSYGGANAITVAAQDARVRCLAVQLTFGDGERVVTGAMSAAEKAKFEATLDSLWSKAVTTNRQLLVPLGKMLTDEQSSAFYAAKREQFPEALSIKIPFLTVKETLTHKPERLLAQVTAPLLIVGAGKDLVNPVAESHRLYAMANAPKELFILDEATHYDAYEGEPFARIVAQQLAWFRTHL